MGASKFLTKAQQRSIVAAIEEAERNTSGEIRVHIESLCAGDPMERAVCLFDQLKMYETAQRNGVLIYVAYQAHKLAIVGDQGIHQVVPSDFWNAVKDQLLADFAAGAFVEGLIAAIRQSGLQLKQYFPYQSDDINEQSDEISFGE